MPITISGTTGIAGVNGSATTPASQGTDTNTGIFYGTDTVSVATNGTTAVTVDSSQNVGIGTTGGTYKLSVANNIQCFAAGTTSALNFGSLTSNSFAKIEYDDSSGDLNLNQIRAYNLKFYTNNTERARIDSSGNLLVGTTTTRGRLTVQGAGQVGMDIRTNDTSDVIFVNANTGGSAASAAYIMPIRTGSTATFRGGVNWDGTNLLYVNASDYRLKDNIADASSALMSILSLQIRQFDWKETGLHTDYGVIAQEAYEHAPEMVSKGETWGVDYGRVAPRLIKAIQELSAKLDAAEARIAALEGAK